MNFEFKLPELGEGLVEGEIVKWFVKVGDTIREHDALAAVLTDKAEVEVPSPRTGKIVQLFGKPGEKIKVHAPLAVIEVSGDAPAAEAKAPETKTAAARAAATPQASERGVLAAPAVRKLAKDKGIDLSRLTGSGPQGRILASDLAAGPAATDVKATPAIRALAASLGVDLARVKGTGPGGRVSEGDVRTSPKAAPKTAASIAGETRTPFVGIRRKIAERMSLSKRTVADVTHVDECEMTALLALRDELKPEAERRGLKLTFLPFIIKALARTLAEFPNFNSSLDETAGELVVKSVHNIGIAVNAPQGLVVPNIKDVDGKDLFALAAEVAALAEKVRSGKISATELQGGTFSITNIGPLGGLYANPIVNYPEVAILGLMKMQKRPVVRDGAVVIRDMMNLCLSFDHRVVDGADAARFMNAVIRYLENPRTLI